MKRCFAAILCAALCAALAACAAGGSDDPAAPPDLTGSWLQVDSTSAGPYQTATITGDSITVRWVSDGTTALFWAGSYQPPAIADEPYQWESVRDTAQTEQAVLAPTEDIKLFTYEGGYLSYTVSAMGVSTTVYLERE